MKPVIKFRPHLINTTTQISSHLPLLHLTYKHIYAGGIHTAFQFQVYKKNLIFVRNLSTNPTAWRTGFGRVLTIQSIHVLETCLWELPNPLQVSGLEAGSEGQLCATHDFVIMMMMMIIQSHNVPSLYRPKSPFPESIYCNTPSKKRYSKFTVTLYQMYIFLISHGVRFTPCPLKQQHHITLTYLLTHLLTYLLHGAESFLKS